MACMGLNGSKAQGMLIGSACHDERRPRCSIRLRTNGVHAEQVPCRLLCSCSGTVQEALGVALLFGARDWLRNNTGADITRPGAFVLACCLIGLLESLIYCPLDHLKARMQVRADRWRDQHEGSGFQPSERSSGLLLTTGLVQPRILGCRYVRRIWT